MAFTHRGHDSAGRRRANAAELHELAGLLVRGGGLGDVPVVLADLQPSAQPN
jgi:hypothetical protein